MGIPHSSTDQEDDALRPPGGAADNTAPSAQADQSLLFREKMHEEDTGRVAGRALQEGAREQRGWAQSVNDVDVKWNSTGRAAVTGVQPLIHMHWRWHPRTSLRPPQQQLASFWRLCIRPSLGFSPSTPCTASRCRWSDLLEDVRRHGTCAAGSGFDYVTAVLRSLNTFGACVSFIISVGDIFKAILDNTMLPAYWKSKSGNRLLTSLLWLTVMLPLVIPRHINSLRHISAVGIVFVIYFVVMIIVHSGMHGLSENAKNLHVTGITTDEGIHLFGTGNRALDGLGVFMLPLCAISTRSRCIGTCQIAVRAASLCAPPSQCFCASSYTAQRQCSATLTSAIVRPVSAILLYDPVKEPEVMVAYIGLLVKLCASFPLISMATRNSLYHSVGWDPRTSWHSGSTASSSSVLPLLHCSSACSSPVSTWCLASLAHSVEVQWLFFFPRFS
ncbi:hypothetical protein TcBrA4_0032690 [Trypanosoma cruzi]|nr:hypothetical protein TcBrA4_0032690 [Trypanosoma cruzi]